MSELSNVWQKISRWQFINITSKCQEESLRNSKSGKPYPESTRAVHCGFQETSQRCGAENVGPAFENQIRSCSHLQTELLVRGELSVSCASKSLVLWLHQVWKDFRHFATNVLAISTLEFRQIRAVPAIKVGAGTTLGKGQFSDGCIPVGIVEKRE